jgi:RNA polymerase sigma-70 factor (ECF subfamily)
MMPSVCQFTADEITRALAGDRNALNRLVRCLRPLIHTEVARMLACYARLHNADPRQQVEDVVQDLFLHLLTQDAQTLRRWAPQRRRSLEGFIRLVTRRRIIDMMRSRRRNPWFEAPTNAEDLELLLWRQEPTLERLLSDGESIERLLDAVHAKFGDQGVELFYYCYVAELSIEEICRLTGESPASIYRWRERFKIFVGRLLTREDASSDHD